MRWERIACIALIVLLLILEISFCAFAQSPVIPVRPVPHPVQAAKPKLEPCWQVAGISKSAIDQRSMIGRETRQQVEAVCANTSLSPQQKQQEIKQIREREKQQMEGLITPEQQSALRTCQQERNPPAPHVTHAPTGPCGEPLPTSHQSPAAGEEQKTPDDVPKPN